MIFSGVLFVNECYKCSANATKNAKAALCATYGVTINVQSLIWMMTYFHTLLVTVSGSSGWSCVSCKSAFKKLTGIVTKLQKKVTCAEGNIEKNTMNIEQ